MRTFYKSKAGVDTVIVLEGFVQQAG